MIKKIIRGILMSVIILIIATVLSLLIRLFQITCPILFTVFFVIVVLVAGFSFANKFWQ